MLPENFQCTLSIWACSIWFRDWWILGVCIWRKSVGFAIRHVGEWLEGSWIWPTKIMPYWHGLADRRQTTLLDKRQYITRRRPGIIRDPYDIEQQHLRPHSCKSSQICHSFLLHRLKQRRRSNSIVPIVVLRSIRPVLQKTRLKIRFSCGCEIWEKNNAFANILPCVDVVGCACLSAVF